MSESMPPMENPETTTDDGGSPSPRLGLIGAGGVAAVHAEAAGRAGVEIVAAFDPDAARAGALVAALGRGRVADSLDALLGADDVDAVVVAVPNRLHAEIALESLDAGKHVLLEKPMAMTAAECLPIVEAAAASDRVVHLNFVCRRAPTIRRARAIVESGALGRIVHARAAIERRRGIPGLGRWFTTRSMAGGGVLADLGVHLIDVLLHLCGRPAPRRVAGLCTSTFGWPIDAYRYEEMWAGPPDPEGTFDVEDGAAALIRCEGPEGPCSIQVEASWASNVPTVGFREGVTVLGDRGGLHLDLWSDLVHRTEPCATGVVDTEDRIALTTDGETPAWDEGWADQHRLFADLVRGERRDEQATPEQGRQVQAVIDAWYASSETGAEQPVAE